MTAGLCSNASVSIAHAWARATSSSGRRSPARRSRASPGRTPRETDAAIARAVAAFEAWRDVPGPAPGRARPPARRGAAPREGGARRARHARGREDRAGGARRGPGDDRHLRLRGRSLAAALRPLDRLGAPGPPADRDVAPARAGRRHQRLQLPGRRLELERRARARLRRPGDLEAVRADAADGDRLACRCFERAAERFGDVPEGLVRARDRRRRPRASSSPTTRASRSSRRPGRRRWARRSRRASRPGSGARCSSSAATTPRSSRRAPISTSSSAASCSRPSARPASAARACAG